MSEQQNRLVFPPLEKMIQDLIVANHNLEGRVEMLAKGVANLRARVLQLEVRGDV